MNHGGLGWAEGLGLVSLFGAMLVATAGAQAQGVTVSESGQAVYSLPIAVPPGVGGMEPKLSLVYSSGGINGPVGVGWALQGISQITRCAKVERVNGKAAVRAVLLDVNDSICLDGQRLFQVTSGSGTYEGTAKPDQSNAALGGTTPEFRTENDGYSRIRASGALSNTAWGPATFTVQSKAGLTSVYGRLDAADDAVVRTHRWNASAGAYQDQHITAWLLKRVTDSVGNTLEFSYDNTTRVWGTKGPNDAVAPGREWNLASVKYGCNLNVACNRWHRVNMVYGDRNDKAEAYHQGGKVVNTQLLQRVEVRVGATADSGSSGTLVRSYRLTHEASARTARNVLKTIAECADEAGTNCLPAHRFTYSGALGNYLSAGSFNLSGTALSSWDGRHSVITGDFNGDGKTDILRTDQWAGQVLDQGAGFPNNLWLASPVTPGAFVAAPKFSDFSDSAATPGASANTIAITRLAWKVDGAATEDESVETVAADINGDGRADLIRLCKSINTMWCPKKVRMWISMTSSANFNAVDYGVFREIDIPAAGPREYATDGTSLNRSVSGPLYTWSENRSVVCREVDDGEYTTARVQASRDALWQDFDGDGRIDLVSLEWSHARASSNCYEAPEDARTALKTLRYYVGRGDGSFVLRQSVTLSAGQRALTEKAKSGLSYVEVMDVNGDGRPDIVFRKNRWVQDASGQFSLIDKPVDPNPLHPDYRMMALDINGDGRTDILTLDPNGTIADPSGSGNMVSANPAAARLFINTGAEDASLPRDDRPLARLTAQGARYEWVVDGCYHSGPNGDESYNYSCWLLLDSANFALGSGSSGATPLDFSGDGMTDFLAWKGVSLSAFAASGGTDAGKPDASLPGYSSKAISSASLPSDLMANGYSFTGGDFLGLGSASFLKLGNNGGNSLWHRRRRPGRHAGDRHRPHRPIHKHPLRVHRRGPQRRQHQRHRGHPGGVPAHPP